MPPSKPSRSSIDEIVEIYKRDVDRTLIAENLARTPEERLLRLQELQRFAEELRESGKTSNRP